MTTREELGWMIIIGVYYAWTVWPWLLAAAAFAFGYWWRNR